MAGEQIHIQLGAVLRLMDSFTGQPVSGSMARVITGEKIQAVQKTDGYTVLLGQQKTYRCKVVSPVFLEEEVELLPYGAEAAQMIWLTPGENYPFPSNTGYLQVTSEKAPIALRCDSQTALPVTENADKGDKKLSLYNDKSLILEGRTLALCTKSMEKAGLIQVASYDRETRVAVLQEPLADACQKIKATAYPVYRGFPQEENRWIIPIPGLQETPSCCLVLTDSGSWKNAELCMGQRLNLSL